MTICFCVVFSHYHKLKKPSLKSYSTKNCEPDFARMITHKRTSQLQPKSKNNEQRPNTLVVTVKLYKGLCSGWKQPFFQKSLVYSHFDNIERCNLNENHHNLLPKCKLSPISHAACMTSSFVYDICRKSICLSIIHLFCSLTQLDPHFRESRKSILSFLIGGSLSSSSPCHS